VLTLSQSPNSTQQLNHPKPNKNRKVEVMYFFECRVARRVWCLCSEWVGEPTGFHREGKSHFPQFNLNWATQEISRSWRCVWIAVVGEIWKQRNQVIFKEGRADNSKIFTLAQLKAWTWLTSKENLAEFTYAH